MAEIDKSTKRTPTARGTRGRASTSRSTARSAKKSATPERKPLSKQAFRAIIACAVVSLLALTWAIGTFHYSSHLVPGTTVNGIDASGLTEDELAAKAETVGALFSNHVSGDEIDFSVASSDIGYSVNGSAFAQDAFAQVQPSHWPLDLLRKPELTTSAGITYDEDLLVEYVWDQVIPFNESAEQPVNAFMERDEETGTFVVVPSQLGTALDVSSVAECIGKRLVVMAPETVLGEDELKRAEILDDDPVLQQTIDDANTLCSLSVPLTLDDNTLATVTPDLISSWVSISADELGYPVINVDRNAIQSWSFRNLNSVVNGENETRTWEVDSYALAQQLAPHLASVDGSALEIPTITISTRPDESEGHETRGRHIDVNLSTQYARLYDTDGTTVLWRSYIVSGNVSMNHTTPTGEYQINNMERGITLMGLQDGVVLEEGQEPTAADYYASYVEYWMCYDGTELGLHDASWRTEDEFGGDTYLWNGSHGCINLPVDAAAELYSLINIGDTVYIHY